MLELVGFLALGLLLVTLGADSFLKGASGFAQGRGVGGFAAGYSLVAVGAAVPELAIATAAVASGHGALAIGTVIGSCIANLGLIIGVSALVKPLSTSFRLIGIALPVLIGSALALMAMSHNGTLGYFDGAALLLAVAGFGWWIQRDSVQETESVRKELAYAANTQTEILRNTVRILIGLAMLCYGAWRAVAATVELAPLLGMSELWMGLTVLAVGASLPALATAVVAAARGHGNVVVGSAIASSVVNLLLVIGLLALWRPIAMPASLLQAEIPALLAFSIAFYPMLRGDAIVSRREGLFLVLAFVGWMVWLILPRF